MQISGSLGEAGRGDYRGIWEIFWDDGHVYFFDCGNVFIGVYTCQNWSNFTLLIYAVHLYVNYPSTELFF